MDYTPLDVHELTGVPEVVISRGNVIVEQGALKATPGQGRFFKRAPVDLRGRPGVTLPEFDPAQNFGADLRS